MVKTKFGHMSCESCGDRVVVKINEQETLSYSCDECEGMGYARKGNLQRDLWLKKIERIAAPPAPAPAASPKPATPPAPKPEAAPAPAPKHKAPGSLLEAAES